MKTISTKSPNLEYYLAAERCNKALSEFFATYTVLQYTTAPFYVKTIEEENLNEHIVVCYEAWLEAQKK